MTTFQTEFIENSLYRLDESTRMITKTFDVLTDAEMWQKPNASSNSIGNLILHLCGNITQYAISSLGEQTDHRERDAEFAAKGGLTKAELFNKLIATVNLAKLTIQNASTEQLLTKRQVQGFNFSGIGIIIHVVEHYSYHTGQIAFWAKLLKDEQLGFYDGLDLNA